MDPETLKILRWPLLVLLGLVLLIAYRKLANSIKRNPTRSWPKAEVKDFLIDLIQGDFQGVNFGDGVKKLQPLGLAVCRYFSVYYTLHYHFCGLSIDLVEDKVDQFNFDFSKAKAEGQEGRLYLKNKDGAEIWLTDRSFRQEILDHLGPPLEEFKDEEGSILEFAVPAARPEQSLALIFQFEGEGLSLLEAGLDNRAPEDTEKATGEFSAGRA